MIPVVRRSYPSTYPSSVSLGALWRILADSNSPAQRDNGGKFDVDHIAVLRVALGGPYGGLGRLPALAAMPGCPRPLLSQICARRQDLGIPQCKRPTTLTSGAIRRPPTTWRRVRHREPRHRAAIQRAACQYGQTALISTFVMLGDILTAFGVPEEQLVELARQAARAELLTDPR